MAFLNLLKANYTGKLGQTVGAKWKNKSVIKSLVLTKTFQSATQTQCVRAFEALNRISSEMAALVPNGIRYDKRSMYLHNAYAKLWKDSVAGHIFIPDTLNNMYPSNPSIQISTFKIDETMGGLAVSIRTQTTLPISQPFYMVALIFDQFGFNIGSQIVNNGSLNILIPTTHDLDQVFHCLVFYGTTEKGNEHIITCNYAFTTHNALVDLQYSEADSVQYNRNKMYVPTLARDDTGLFSTNSYGLVIPPGYGLHTYPQSFVFQATGQGAMQFSLTYRTPDTNVWFRNLFTYNMVAPGKNEIDIPALDFPEETIPRQFTMQLYNASGPQAVYELVEMFPQQYGMRPDN